MNAPHPPATTTRGITPDSDAAAVHLQALRLLAAQPEISQRQLSRELGLSVGKTHYVLHALLDKGLLKIRNFRRSNNKLAYAYLLTAQGLREKLRLTHAFLARKETEFEELQVTIAQLRLEVLQGPGDSSRDSDRSDRGA
jgi:EPS-associated MarR family transcriptional regulator